VEGLQSHFLLITLMKDKYLLHNIKWGTYISYTILMRDEYLLHNINHDGNMVGREMNILDINNLC